MPAKKKAAKKVVKKAAKKVVKLYLDAEEGEVVSIKIIKYPDGAMDMALTEPHGPNIMLEDIKVVSHGFGIEGANGFEVRDRIIPITIKFGNLVIADDDFYFDLRDKS